MLGSYLSKRNHKGLVLGANNTTCVCVIVGAKHMVAEMNVREFSISKNDRTSNSNSNFLTLPTILTLGRVAAVPLLVASMFVILWRFKFFFFKCFSLFLPLGFPKCHVRSLSPHLSTTATPIAP